MNHEGAAHIGASGPSLATSRRFFAIAVVFAVVGAVLGAVSFAAADFLGRVLAFMALDIRGGEVGGVGTIHIIPTTDTTDTEITDTETTDPIRPMGPMQTTAARAAATRTPGFLPREESRRHWHGAAIIAGGLTA